MTDLEQSIDNLIDYHKLTNITIARHKSDNIEFFTIYVHWAPGGCVSGTSDSINGALDGAIDMMNKDRQPALEGTI